MMMTDTFEDHEGTVSIGGTTITKHCVTDDIDSLAEEEEQLATLVERLDKASTAHGMGNQCREDQAGDEQHLWHQHRDQSEWTEA